MATFFCAPNQHITPESYKKNVPPNKPFVSHELIKSFGTKNLKFIKYCFKYSDTAVRKDTYLSWVAASSKNIKIFDLIIKYECAVDTDVFREIGLKRKIKHMKRVYSLLESRRNPDLRIMMRDAFLNIAFEQGIASSTDEESMLWHNVNSTFKWILGDIPFVAELGRYAHVNRIVVNVGSSDTS
jgi:hypothetical protein